MSVYTSLFISLCFNACVSLYRLVSLILLNGVVRVAWLFYCLNLSLTVTVVSPVCRCALRFQHYYCLISHTVGYWFFLFLILHVIFVNQSWIVHYERNFSCIGTFLTAFMVWPPGRGQQKGALYWEILTLSIFHLSCPLEAIFMQRGQYPEQYKER